MPVPEKAPLFSEKDKSSIEVLIGHIQQDAGNNEQIEKHLKRMFPQSAQKEIAFSILEQLASFKEGLVEKPPESPAEQDQKITKVMNLCCAASYFSESLKDPVLTEATSEVMAILAEEKTAFFVKYIDPYIQKRPHTLIQP